VGDGDFLGYIIRLKVFIGVDLEAVVDAREVGGLIMISIMS